MQIKDDVIIDGNAVYEIDDNCKSEVHVTGVQKDNDIMFQLLLLLSLFMR